MRGSLSRFFRRFARVAGAGLILWLMFSTFSIAHYATLSNEQPADGIIVLGAAAWGNQPSPVFRERINHALMLYHQGYAPVLIFTGGRVIAEELAESEVAQQYAIDHGIPPKDILIETRSRSTVQNLFYAEQLAAQHHLTRLIIVSDPLHMKRAMTIATDQGLTAYSSPTPTTMYRSWPTWLRFLFRESYYYQRYLTQRWLDNINLVRLSYFSSSQAVPLPSGSRP